MPHNLRAEQPRVINEDEAKAKAEADFVEALDKECLVATDGAGGAVGARSERHRSVGAGSVVVTFGPNRTPNTRNMHAHEGARKTDGAQSRNMGSLAGIESNERS